MVEEALTELDVAIDKAHESLGKQFSRVRTGRANPALLDSLRVDSYGSMTPIAQLATVGVPEARMLTITPWDKNNIKAIEKALMQSDLGLNPQNDGAMIRVPLPALTEERRKEFVKLARKYGEDCRIALRKARHVCKDKVSALKENSEISEDDLERAKKKIEDRIQQASSKVDEHVARKEKDILEV